MSTVGLAMIVRDAAETLGVCLQSVEGLFDDLCVVDTGSTDATKDIATAYGARVLEFPWINDFAAARNYAWDHLTTDWKAWLDADDLFLGREHFDEMVRRCEALQLDGVVLEYLYAFDAVGERWLAELEPSILARRVSSAEAIQKLRWPRCVTTQWRERFVRNDPTWRWCYPVHEALPAVGRHLGKFDAVKIVHRRHVRKNPVPSRRNLDILLAIPDAQRDERHWFYLGMEHAHHRAFALAIQSFETYLPLSTVKEEEYLAYHFLADLYRETGQEDRAIRADLSAVAIRPHWRDAYAGLLQTCVKRQDWMQALYYGARCKQAEIPDTPFAYNPLQEEVGWVGDYVRALYEAGQYEEALHESERALSIVPEDVAHAHNVDTLAMMVNLRSGQERIADTLEFFLRHDDAETAAVLVSRLDPGIRSFPRIRPWVEMLDRVCGRAASGGIQADQLKVDPACPPVTDEQRQEIWWADPRVRAFREFVSRHPEIRSVLQVGGPVETLGMYQNLGLLAARTEFTEEIGGQYDAVILWGCLERVQQPDVLVERARACVRPGGWVVACVPNGPHTKGLGPPEEARLRLRSFSVDGFRQVMGTMRMPSAVGGWSADAGDLWLEVPGPPPRARSKHVAIVCPLPLAPWGPWSLEQGLGGSEEAVIRLGRALARRGHEVRIYGSGWGGRDENPDSSGPEYLPLTEYRRADVVIGWRYPEVFVNQFRPFEGEWRALWLHDTVARDRVEIVAPVLDLIWCISNYHAGLYQGIPHIYRGRNGIDPVEFEAIESVFHVERNPQKCVYLSTPFRGLGVLLAEHWPEIKRRVPEAEVHCFYGWESADQMGVTATPDGARFKAAVTELARQPGVVWRGRVGQPELYRELLSAGAWLYPTTWAEESCISAMIAQAAGVWPVVYPLGALPQTVVFGWKVLKEQFVNAAVDAIRTLDGRHRMIQWARRWLSWDDVAATWESLWSGRDV